MKVVVNLFIILTISYLVFLNQKEEIKINKILIKTKNLIINPKNHEENLELAKKERLPEKIISKINKNRLEEAQDISLGELSISYEIDSEAAFWTVEDNWYAYSVVVFYKGEVVLQFNGHLDKNMNPFSFKDLDVVAFRPGIWQSDL